MSLGGMPLARVKSGGTKFMVADHLGTPLIETNWTGVVDWEEHYMPFGEQWITHANNDNDTGFTGHVQDDTGLTCHCRGLLRL